eukprot:3180302-Prymnesium_polylepis.1
MPEALGNSGAADSGDRRQRAKRWACEGGKPVRDVVSELVASERAEAEELAEEARAALEAAVGDAREVAAAAAATARACVQALIDNSKDARAAAAESAK